VTVRADYAGVGVLGGLALGDAQSVFLPLGPGHVAALGRANATISLTPDQAAETNARQLVGALEYVYLRPGSPLMDTARQFATQRKAAFGTAELAEQTEPIEAALGVSTLDEFKGLVPSLFARG
jgi:hypothetical protein